MVEKFKNTFISKNYRPVLRGTNLMPPSEGSTKIATAKNEKKSVRSPVILVAKDDCSQTLSVLRSNYPENLQVLYYDDLGETWDYSFCENELLFHLHDTTIIPTGVYNRPFFPTEADDNLNLFLYLAHALELWEGPLIGARLDNPYNGSKAYQLISTIKTTMQNSHAKITTPKTYILKGSEVLLDKLLQREKKLIVKSCSGIRSKVVNQQEFQKWDLGNLKNLPTLFQKEEPGIDVRIHVLKDQIWAIQVAKKDGVDYRYAKNRSEYELYELSEEQISFCKLLANTEDLHLVGIDLLVDQEHAVCLECNPGPGWAGFHRNSGDEISLIHELLTTISGKNEALSL